MSGILNALIGSYAPVGGSFESIATATGTGSSGIITFTSIPSNYQHLQIRGIYKDGNNTNDTALLNIGFNNDSGTNYATHSLRSDGSAVTALGTASRVWILARGAGVFSDSNLANIVGSSIIDIHDYASTTKNKTVRIFSGADLNGSGIVAINSGVWLSTNAITRIDLLSNGTTFTNQTTFALYGIKG